MRLSDQEVKLISERGVNVVHCPHSNLGSHGFIKTPIIMASGANIALGTGGLASSHLDLFEQLRLLKAAMHASYGMEINDPLVLLAFETLKMVTSNGVQAVMMAEMIGVLV